MGQDPFDVRIFAHEAVVDQVRRRARGFERILDTGGEQLHAERRHVSGAGGMDEDRRAAPIQFGIERLQPCIAEIDAVLVGEQEQPVGVQRIESIGHLTQRPVDIGRRQDGEEAQAVGRRRDELGQRLVGGLGQR